MPTRNIHLTERLAGLEALRREVMIGVEQYERGDTIRIASHAELRQFFDDIHKEIEEELATGTSSAL